MKILTVAWVIFEKDNNQFEISRNGGSVMISDIAEYIGKKEESFLYQGALPMPNMRWRNVNIIGNDLYLPLERTVDNIDLWQDGLMKGLTTCIEKEKFDFVFVHGGGEFCYNALLRCIELKQKCAYVLHINEDFILGENSRIYKIPNLKMILVGNKIKEDMIKKCNWINNDQLHVIINGVPRLNNEISTTKRRGKKRLICVGSLQPRKNQIQLIRAFALVPKEIREKIELVLCGKELKRYPILKDIEQEIIKHNLKDSVEYIGSRRREEMIELYEDADALVLPSIREGLSLVVLEMLQLGKPVIMFSDNETAYDINDSKATVLVNEHSDISLAEAIVRWFNIEWNKDYIKKYASYYTIERVADEYIAYSKNNV